MIPATDVRVLATICARGGSKGVPGKNTLSVAGRSLVEYAIESARACPEVGEIVVSTDDDKVADLAEQCGIEVPFRRPLELATDDAPKIGAIRHATQYVERHRSFFPDVVVDLDVGVPMRRPEDITACVNRCRMGDVDAAVTVYESERNPYFNMVEFDGPLVKLVKVPQRVVTRRQDAPDVFSITPSVFAYRRDRLMSITHLYDGRWGACIVPRESGVDIDHGLDLAFVEFLLTRSPRRNNFTQ